MEEADVVKSADTTVDEPQMDSEAPPVNQTPQEKDSLLLDEVDSLSDEDEDEEVKTIGKNNGTGSHNVAYPIDKSFIAS